MESPPPHSVLSVMLRSPLESEPLSSQKEGKSSCPLFANSLLIGSLILHADVFLFFKPMKGLKNSSPRLEIRIFHLKSGFHIAIQKFRRSDPLGHMAGADILYSGHILAILLQDPHCPHAISMRICPIHFVHLGCSCPVTLSH